MNDINKNKTTTLKTLLMLSIISMIIVPGGIIPVYAAPENVLLTINNPIPSPDDYFGWSVATTPAGDILVGALNDDTNSPNAGSVYLFDGIDGSLLLTINNPTPVSKDNFGNSVATTPAGDLLVGAFQDDTGTQNAGSVYLFDGNDGSLLLTINNPTPGYLDNFGISVATTPAGDLLVGAENDDTDSPDTGIAYLFDGNDGSLLLTINSPTPGYSEHFGVSVATTNTGDLLVGADLDNVHGSAAGAAHLFDGNDGSLLLTINSPTPSISERFGHSVATTNTDDLLVGAYYDFTGTSHAGSVYLFEGISTDIPSPIITSLVADDPDDLDDIYFREDTITITFDSETNTPGGTDVQRKPAVDDMFTFSESLGRAYSGKWIASDTFVITIHSDNNAGPPVIGVTTVTPAGITPIFSDDETSYPSSATSPVLSGDFGIP